MKARILLSLLFVCSLLTNTLRAQDDVTARFKYEESEEAYNNGKYKDALDKLDEVDKLLGGKANPKTLYLRIMAQDKLLGDDPYANIPVFRSLKQHIAQYVKAYSSQSSLEDKVRAVYKVGEERKVYSDNEDTYAGLTFLKARDTTAAKASFTKAANDGDVEAMNQLGILYAAGFDLPKPDNTGALEWFTRSAEKGNASAMRSLGDLYSEGHGIAEDPGKAMEWYTKAADKGNTAAMYRIGILYLNGKGVPEDPATGIAWITKAADNGYVFAMIYMALECGRGKRVPKDKAKEADWLARADAKAEGTDNKDIMVKLAYYYSNQLDPPNYYKAREWYQKLAAKGSKSAAEWLAKYQAAQK